MREKYFFIIFCKTMHRSEAFNMDEDCFNCLGNNLQSISDRLNMKSEKDRLQTFDVWQYSHIQDPRILAKAGLYYTGIDDKVKCPFCYGLLKKWERSDVPYHEHAKYFPKCRFIRGYDVGNIPISVPRDMINMHINYNGNNILYNGHQFPVASSNALIPPEPVPYSVNCAASNPVIQNGQTKVIYQGIPQPPGDFQDFYKHQENRLRSYSNWPRNLPQTPEVLSEAGFYHKPTPDKPDRVKCAYCAGKLFNWQVDDDPWIEHARCFHQCKYVQLCMGRDFVQDLLGGQEHLQEHAENGQVHQPPFNSQYGEPSASPETSPKPSSLPPSILHMTSEDPVSVRMTSEPVQALLQMGFPEQTVKQTVERCVRDRPNNFPPAEELASMLMELEDQLPVEAAEPTPVMTPLQRLMATQSSGSGVVSEALTNGVVHSTVIENGCDEISTPQRLTTAAGSDVRKGIDLKMRKDPISTVNGNGLTTQHSGVRINGAVNGLLNHKRDIDTENLKSENSKLKDQFLCKICMENFVRVTFMPCGHLVCCASCSINVSDCPICRAPISGFVRTYF